MEEVITLSAQELNPRIFNIDKKKKKRGKRKKYAKRHGRISMLIILNNQIIVGVGPEMVHIQIKLGTIHQHQKARWF